MQSSSHLTRWETRAGEQLFSWLTWNLVTWLLIFSGNSHKIWRRVATQLIQSSIDTMMHSSDELVGIIRKHHLRLAQMSNLVFFSTGSNVLSYVNMVCATLRNSIPKSIVYSQVREAKRSLLDHFMLELGRLDVWTSSLPSYSHLYHYVSFSPLTH